jgi:hypothetical protein
MNSCVESKIFIRPSKAVIFEFINPSIIIEWQAPLQERHWLELQRHLSVQNIRRSEIEPRRICHTSAPAVILYRVFHLIA